MSEMIDGYTAQKIKDFWMSHPDRAGAHDISVLYSEIEKLGNQVAALSNINAAWITTVGELRREIETWKTKWAEARNELAKLRLEMAGQ